MEKPEDYYYRSIVSMLDEDLPKMTRDDRFAYFGYIRAYMELEHISPEEAVELEQRLGLTVEEIEALCL